MRLSSESMGRQCIDLVEKLVLLYSPRYITSYVDLEELRPFEQRRPSSTDRPNID